MTRSFTDIHLPLLTLLLLAFLSALPRHRFIPSAVFNSHRIAGRFPPAPPSDVNGFAAVRWAAALFLAAIFRSRAFKFSTELFCFASAALVFFIMNSDRIARCLLLCTFALVLWVDNTGGETFYFDLLHRYSSELRFEIEARNWPAGNDWPVEGSWEYHNRLMHHDRDRHRSRNLLGSNGTYSFAPVNTTTEFLGGLHYTFLELGTPIVQFLVALDTGSDLLWVPCDCKSCAPTNGTAYGLPSSINFSVFDPSNSTTSKTITCIDAMCETAISQYTCVEETQICNYIVSYLQPNTSTSGILIEDILYLNSESLEGKAMSTPIYFGCGEEQTGTFLSGDVAPNGLLGLGLDRISIPSTLSRSGLVSNSFSMCFSASDNSGRLVFGEKGRSDLESTSLKSLEKASAYVVTTTYIIVGDDLLSLSQDFVFDTGSSFTLMPEASVKSIGTILNKKIPLTPFPESGIFDYCWNISTPTDLSTLLPLTLVFSGGSNMTLSTPYVLFEADNIVCLGVVTSDTIPIIAHNFMRGYEFFFNRDSSSLSWTITNCSFPNGTLATSPEASVPVKSPQVSPTPSTASTPLAASPKTDATLAPPPKPGTNSTSSNSAQCVHFNVFVLCICTIIIRLYL